MDIAKARFRCLAAAGTLAAALALVSGGRNVAFGQSDVDRTWTYEWAAPTTGSAPAWYQAELLTNSRDTTVIDRLPGATVTVPVVLGNDYQLRVRAYSAAGVPGPYSSWSAMETAEEAPPTNESGAASR